jgi:hypothetical protein
MKTTTNIYIYTNGTTLFTLENYGKTAGVSHANNITLVKEISKIEARAMHTKGSLHYIFGMGDRNVLQGSFKRGSKGNFQIK